MTWPGKFLRVPFHRGARPFLSQLWITQWRSIYIPVKARRRSLKTRAEAGVRGQWSAVRCVRAGEAILSTVKLLRLICEDFRESSRSLRLFIRSAVIVGSGTWPWPGWVTLTRRLEIQLISAKWARWDLYGSNTFTLPLPHWYDITQVCMCLCVCVCFSKSILWSLPLLLFYLKGNQRVAFCFLQTV